MRRKILTLSQHAASLETPRAERSAVTLPSAEVEDEASVELMGKYRGKAGRKSQMLLKNKLAKQLPSKESSKRINALVTEAFLSQTSDEYPSTALNQRPQLATQSRSILAATSLRPPLTVGSGQYELIPTKSRAPYARPGPSRPAASRSILNHPANGTAESSAKPRALKDVYETETSLEGRLAAQLTLSQPPSSQRSWNRLQQPNQTSNESKTAASKLAYEWKNIYRHLSSNEAYPRGNG